MDKRVNEHAGWRIEVTADQRARALEKVALRGPYDPKQDEGQSLCEAICEVVVADLLDLPVNMLGGHIVLRTRLIPAANSDLILHQSDKDKAERPFVLAHALKPEGSACFVKGWIYGREGLKRRYWRDLEEYKPHGACFIPPEELRDVAELIELRRKQ
jgi:hypothetical protein